MNKLAKSLLFEWTKFGGGLLASLVFVCALLVIYQKHLCRQLFMELQKQEQEIESLQVEWSQLLLEQGTWSADARLERIARKHMQMVLPEPNEVIVIAIAKSDPR